MKKGIVMVCILLCVLFILPAEAEQAWKCPLCGEMGNNALTCRECGASIPEELRQEHYWVGDIVTFGKYEQDNRGNNGPETIEWLVLAYDQERLLLVTKYGLDAKYYNDEGTNISWKSSTLRLWLNNDFLNTAFSKEEQKSILTTEVDNSRGQGYAGWTQLDGIDTFDKIFLLSFQEAFYDYFIDDEDRTAKPTPYAIAKGAKKGAIEGNCWWWLRSPGRSMEQVASVARDGFPDSDKPNELIQVVRPALWLKLDKNKK